MKNFKFLFLSLIFVLLMTSCYRVTPNGGVESVLTHKPFIFGDGGVDSKPITTGSQWVWITTDHTEFIVTPVTYTEEFPEMMPSDNTPVSFAAYLELQAIRGKTPILLNDFSADWYKNSLQPTFRTMVRDKACPFKMFDLVSKREISAQLEQDITKDITAYVEKLGLPVKVKKVSIGAVTPPEQVLTETKNTAAQNQSKLTQAARADAELARKQAEINKAIADNAYMKEMGMSVNEYLHLRQLEIEKEKVELIKDNKNATVIFGQSVPFSYPVK